MNVSIISTYREKNVFEKKEPKRLSKVLLELAEVNLKSPECRHFISLEGIAKVKKKLAS